MKQKAFFIILNGFSLKQLKMFLLEGESPTFKFIWSKFPICIYFIEKVANYHLHFLILFFSKIILIVMFHSAVAFERYKIYQILFNVHKIIMAWKISAIIKKWYLNSFITESVIIFLYDNGLRHERAKTLSNICDRVFFVKIID